MPRQPRAAEPLRLVTYLSPGIPKGFFSAIARFVGRKLGCQTLLEERRAASGPAGDGDDPFSSGSADVGFLCSMAYLRMRERQPPSCEVLGAAPVFMDPRAEGRPVYFSEVLVAAGAKAECFEDLKGMKWTFNDTRSLSGYLSILGRLADLGEDVSFFAKQVRAGSHMKAVYNVICGKADAAAVDTNVLEAIRRTEPEALAGLKTIETLGPFPIYPIVVRRGLGVKNDLTEILLDGHTDPSFSAELESFGVERFAPVTEATYAEAPALKRIAEVVS